LNHQELGTGAVLESLESRKNSSKQKENQEKRNQRLFFRFN